MARKYTSLIAFFCASSIPYSGFADRWESLASHINTDAPPGELTKEVNDLLHQTFDKKAQ
ncbi:hypothetical protein P618_200969 [Holospora obtusa F1]|uniref:Uncharacterized protein n=1 Tax=Holospora obtusa F1 TaxID=1399147 RepID=W6TSV9_HOLOB|nr:hypothetical protein [Holospora obtusa]ETZ06857.1 hypothetical protein P618_200969 [Holospora obtusa F1]